MRVNSNFSLEAYNSYRLKSECKFAYFPDIESDIIEFFRLNDKFVILGNGNNVILSKEEYDESFLIFNETFNHIKVEAEIIEAQAGATMLELSELAFESSLTGFEIFYDIPSSVGGAIVMNAGAGGVEIKDFLLKVKYLDLTTHEVKEISGKDIDFEYRNSFFQRNNDKIVLKAWFKLAHGNKEEIFQGMKEGKESRFKKQPREFPNGGSVFKRPPGKFVGPMIEELGLKGYQVGGAKVSEKHGGFIINTGNATGKDILLVIDHIKDKVYARYNIKLEVEQRII